MNLREFIADRVGKSSNEIMTDLAALSPEDLISTIDSRVIEAIQDEVTKSDDFVNRTRMWASIWNDVVNPLMAKFVSDEEILKAIAERVTLGK